MRSPGIFLVTLLALSLPAPARMGDSVAQTAARYGQPVAGSGRPGELTSTHTFSVSGLQVTCGYVGGKVEMETYSRDDRDFNPQEVEALLRTNGGKRGGWTTPTDGYVNGTYQRTDGVTATLTGSKLAIQSAKWTDALARDQATEKAAANKAASEANGATTNNPNYITGSATNAASYVEPSASTNAAPHTNSAVTTTNAP